MGQWHDMRRLREIEIEAAVAIATAAMFPGMFFRPEENGLASEGVDNAQVLQLLEVNSLYEDERRNVGR